MHIRPTVSFLDKLLFTKHLAVMIRSGITVAESLETLVAQTKSSHFRHILSLVLADVENGKSLATALQKHPAVFDQFYTSLVEVGEESGTLENNLDFLGRQLNKDYALRKKIQGALLYPTIIFFATTVMGGFISLFILPKLVDFFSAFQIKLPLSTQILLFFANLMKNHGVIIILGLFGLTSLFSFIIQIPSIKRRWHRFILLFPLFGNLLISGQLAHFSRNLGTLLKSGVSILTSLQTTKHTLDNLAYREALDHVQEEIKKGKSLATGLETFHASLGGHTIILFPPLVIKMIAVGEKTGKLEETLLYLSDFYDDEIDNFSKNLTTVLEPILLLGIGLIVGFVAIAIISPIYELTGSIRR